MPNSNIIGSIKITPENPRPFETIMVEVLDSEGKSFDHIGNTSITINGIPGAVQYLQLSAVHEYKIKVEGCYNGSREKKETSVSVSGSPLTFSHNNLKRMALVNLHQSQIKPYEAVLFLGSYVETNYYFSKTRSFRTQNLDLQKVIERPKRLVSSFLDQDVMISREPFWGSSVTGKWIKTTAILSNSLLEKQENEQLFKVKKNYEWDFGNGEKVMTATPELIYDFSDKIDYLNDMTIFNIKCRILNQNIEIKRTLTIYSSYAQCKKGGFIVPPMIHDIFASKEYLCMTASLEIKNVEDQPITLEKQAIIIHSNDPDALIIPAKHKNLSTNIVIGPKTSSFIGINLIMDEDIPYDAPGFAVYYGGKSAEGKPVRVSANFEIPMKDRHIKPKSPFDDKPDMPVEKSHVWPWEEVESIIDSIINNPDSEIRMIGGDVVFDNSTKSIATNVPFVALDKSSVKRKIMIESILKSAIIPGHLKTYQLGKHIYVKSPEEIHIIKKGMKNLADICEISVTNRSLNKVFYTAPPLPGPLEEGQICDPDNLPDEQAAQAREKQLVCQFSNEEMIADIPARFMNARKGDIILSPGGNTIIGSLLRGLSPKQVYSHSGIMTRNYDEVTHSVASMERLKDYTRGIIYNASDGFEPRALKYMWPGVVRQSVYSATEGEAFVDPENNKSYLITFFSDTTANAIGSSDNGQFEIVPPLVVKPDLFLETEEIRSNLHSLANDAKTYAGRPGINSKSHYRLYCFSNPEIQLSTQAPADAGWAAGTIPSVCSSFIWMLLYKRGYHMESNGSVMPKDLERNNILEGAYVSSDTLDGLYTYTREERLTGAKMMYDYACYMASEKAGVIGNIITDAGDDYGNQIANVFINDNADGKDSDEWRNTTDASAVSPQNILWWDSPAFGGLYGYAEPLVYREPRSESYEVSKWKKIITRGTITGNVSMKGSSVGGASVSIYSGKSTSTDSTGNYVLNDVPLGRYKIKASKVMNNMQTSAYNDYLSVEQIIDLHGENLTVNLELQEPDERFRLAEIAFDFRGRDEEIFSNEICDPGMEYCEIPLGLDSPIKSKTFQYQWGGELRVEYTFNLSLMVGYSIQLQVIGKLYEGTSEDNKDLDGDEVISVIVPINRTIDATITITNEYEDEGDNAELKIRIRNARNTN